MRGRQDIRDYREGTRLHAALAEGLAAGKFDLLIMGSHGHGALATLVMGSVTTHVLANSKVPVLLVR